MTQTPENDVYEFPVSATQATFWYMYQVEPDSTAYTIPLGFRIRGPLKSDLLVDAFRQVVARHEVLRTNYREKQDGQLVQVVYPSIDLPYSEVDLAGLDAETAESQLDEQLAEQFRRPIYIDREPVLRLDLYRLPGDEAVLLVSAHHIAVDHMAFGLIFDEVSAIYSALLENRPHGLDEPELQYADYVVWQQERLAEIDRTARRKSWTEKLSAFDGVLEIPTTHPRPKLQTFAGRDYYFSLSETTSAAAKAYSRDQGHSIFLTLLTCLMVVYQRYSRQSDIVVGTPFSDRNQDEVLESVVGCFINTLPLASDIDERASFEDLLATVKSTMMHAYENQIVPLEDIVHERGNKRDLSRNPLFQVGFVFQEPPMPLSLQGTETATMDLDNFGAMYDIHTYMWDTGSVLRGLMSYNSDLFDRAAIERFSQTLDAAVEALVSAPSTAVGDLPFLCANDAALIASANQNEEPASTDRSVVDLIRRQAELTPDATAVIGVDGTLSYEALERASNAIANELVTAGVDTGSLVGLSVSRSCKMLAAAIGVWKAGAAYVPLDIAFPRDRLAYMLDAASVSVVVADEGSAARLPSFDGQLLRVDESWDTAQTSTVTVDRTPSGGEDRAYVIFTSGSTGRPKGVQVPHRSVVNFLDTMIRRPGIGKDDRLLAVTTLSFDISVLELFAPLACGATCVIATTEQSSDGRQLAALLDEHDVSVMQATPSTWRLLLHEGWGGADSGAAKLKVLCGGEAFPQDLADTLVGVAGSVWNMYGPTETTVWSTCCEITADDSRVTIGTPVGSTQVYVLNPGGQPVPVGVPGELHIGGAGVTLGYLGDAEKTAAVFKSTPTVPRETVYATGDLVRLLPSGRLEYLQRLDNQVKLRGFRIELGEIESVLSEHDSVNAVVANIWSAGDDDKRLVAYIVANGNRVNAVQLRKHLRTRLPDYMIPQHFVQLDEFPKTANNKIDRAALPSPAGVERTAEKTPPETELEQLVAGVWGDVVGSGDVYKDDYFFDIGGHSLLAVKAISLIEQKCGVRLNPRMIVMHSLTEIAEFLSSEQQPATA